MSTHTLSVLVENKPGVLAHVAGLFSRRAFNISSLAVGPTEDERVSRMTIVVDGASTPVEQVAKQLDKLVRVLKVVELDEGAAVERELALIKVRIDPALRGELLEVATVFHTKVVDMSPETVILEATSSPGKLDSLLAEPGALRHVRARAHRPDRDVARQRHDHRPRPGRGRRPAAEAV